jgi:hypothetical protein
MDTKCKTCNKEYTPMCDYMQGRCPHHPSLADQILNDPYKARFLNLFNAIKNVFRSKP